MLARYEFTADVWFGGAIHRGIALDNPAQLITDPHRQAEQLQAAMSCLHEQARTAQARYDRQLVEHNGKLDDIRAYAIARHRADDICRSGLDKFLTEFGLAAYEPTARVRFTITGSYLVRGDADAARYDGRDFLAVDYSNVDDVVDGTEECRVHIDSVEDTGDED